MLYRFHLNLFAKPPTAAAGPAVTLRAQSLPSLKAPAWTAFLPVSFEEALAALMKLPRLDAEPDGFFVIAGDYDGARWQVDGHLFDFDDRLHRVELRGECPPEMFDSITACFGSTPTEKVYELIEEGVALDEQSFRQWAAAFCR